MSSLNAEDIKPHKTPFPLFSEWFNFAATCNAIKDVTAMTLSTVDADQQPWSRIVLLKEFDERGFTFFTNSNSIKGGQLSDFPKVSLCFYWPALDQQIRIMGASKLVPPEESGAYFTTRPRESQIGAWASIQSSELDTRQTLMERVEKFSAKYEGQDVPRPDFWNGYRVTPSIIEFWLSRPHRLHERIVYKRELDDTWSHKGLYP